MVSPNVSNFYRACRNNDFDRVKYMLSHISVDEINRLEMTNLGESTALHAASYYGNYEVVKLLLEHGAEPTIKNFDRATAADEAMTRDIRCLFRQYMKVSDMKNGRFGQSGLDLEWIAINRSIVEKAPHYRRWLEVGSHNMEYSAYTIISNYLEKKERLKNEPEINKIKELFRQAAETHDPTYIVRAYTMETVFYRCLNEDLAATTIEILNSNLIFDRRVEEFWSTHGRIAGIMARHPKLNRLTYYGKCYRGMQMSDTQIFHYKLGTRIMTKSFSSCSRIQEIAMSFAMKGDNHTAEKFPTLCTYNIRNQCSALDIAELSVFPKEQEVLIASFSVFKIIQIRCKMFESTMDNGTTGQVEGREIELEECEIERSGCSIM